MRAEVRVTGKRAHSARSWNGTNAIHAAAPVPGRAAAELRGPRARGRGLKYTRRAQRGLHQRGVAGNVHPGRVRVTVNHRSPGPPVGAGPGLRPRSRGLDVTFTDWAQGPGRPDRPGPATLLATGGGPPGPSRWTGRGPLLRTRDAGSTTAPGDPEVALPREHVPVARSPRWSPPPDLG